MVVIEKSERVVCGCLARGCGVGQVRHGRVERVCGWLGERSVLGSAVSRIGLLCMRAFFCMQMLWPEPMVELNTLLYVEKGLRAKSATAFVQYLGVLSFDHADADPRVEALLRVLPNKRLVLQTAAHFMVSWGVDSSANTQMVAEALHRAGASPQEWAKATRLDEGEFPMCMASRTMFAQAVMRRLQALAV